MLRNVLVFKTEKSRGKTDLRPYRVLTSEQGLGCSLPQSVGLFFSPVKWASPMFRKGLQEEPMASDSSGFTSPQHYLGKERAWSLSLSIYVVTGVDSCSVPRPSAQPCAREQWKHPGGPMCVCKGVLRGRVP